MNLSLFGFSRKFINDSFWSLFGNLVSVFAGFAVIKIITRLVAVDDYGKASLVLGVVALLNGLIMGPLLIAHMRIYFDYLKSEAALWYARVFNLVFGAAGLLALLIYVLIAYGYNFRGNNIFVTLIVPAALMIFAQPYVSAVSNYLEAHRLYIRLAMVNISQKLLYPIILILLLTAAFSGSYAIVLSQAISIIAVFLIFRVISEQKAFDKKPAYNWKEFVKIKASFASFGFSLPLGYFIHWVLSTSDRYLIQHYMTLDDVGIYAMNYGLWSIPYSMLIGWLEILVRPHLYGKAVMNDWQGVKQIIFWRTIFAFIVSVAGTWLIYMWGEFIAELLLGKSYWIGWQLMMIIAIAHCICILGQSVMTVFLASKHTRIILVATSTAAMVNLGINLVAIPNYGLLGAAMSTLIAYFIWSAILVLWSCVHLQHLIRHNVWPEEKLTTY